MGEQAPVTRRTTSNHRFTDVLYSCARNFSNRGLAARGLSERLGVFPGSLEVEEIDNREDETSAAWSRTSSSSSSKAS